MSQRIFACVQVTGYGLVVLALLLAHGCSEPDPESQSSSEAVERTESGQVPKIDADLPAPTNTTSRDDADLHPEVTIKTSMGDITVKLDAQNAPVTVKNFLDNYVSRGHYSGTIFHYVEPGRTVMGGGYSENLELKEVRAQITSEADNGLKNQRGTIAMTRSPDHPHTATSQFFFNLDDNPAFDHMGRDTPEDFGYCVFGEVVSGMDVLDRIGQVELEDIPKFPSYPKTPVVIRSVQLGP